ncbi:MAG: cyclic nucleotide-binding protein [Methylococcus sp.]|nr:MAG: cyclic nucleotide-binding protein [Methylococcus sp.]
MLFEENDDGHEMFVIQEGNVQLYRKVNGTEVLLITLGRGDFFGEMSLLESLPRTATAKASSQTKVLVLGSGALLLRLRRDPTFSFEILQKMSSRVRFLNESINDLCSEGKIDEEALQNILNKDETITGNED